MTTADDLQKRLLGASGSDFLEALASASEQAELLRSTLSLVPPARHYERRALELCLFGCGSDEDLVGLVDAYSAALRYGRATRCHALWLAERTIGIPPTNPWGLDASMNLAHALTHVWRPMLDLASDAIDLVQQEVLALALIENDEHGWLLGYVTLWRHEEGEGFDVPDDAPRPPLGRAHCAAWAPFAGLSMFQGSEPCEPTSLGIAALPIPDGFVDSQLTALWRVHGSLNAGMARLDEPSTLSTLDALYELSPTSDGHRDFVAESGGVDPSAFLVLFGYGDDSSELLFVPDDDSEEEPMIHWFAAQDWALGEGVPFSEWWPRRLAQSFLKLDLEEDDD